MYYCTTNECSPMVYQIGFFLLQTKTISEFYYWSKEPKDQSIVYKILSSVYDGEAVTVKSQEYNHLNETYSITLSLDISCSRGNFTRPHPWKKDSFLLFYLNNFFSIYFMCQPVSSPISPPVPSPFPWNSLPIHPSTTFIQNGTLLPWACANHGTSIWGGT